MSWFVRNWVNPRCQLFLDSHLTHLAVGSMAVHKCGLPVLPSERLIVPVSVVLIRDRPKCRVARDRSSIGLLPRKNTPLRHFQAQ